MVPIDLHLFRELDWQDARCNAWASFEAGGGPWIKRCAVPSQERENILEKVAAALEANEEEIMEENAADVEAAEGKIDDHLMNRLRLKPQKIKQLGDGIRSIAAQKEPLRKVGAAAPWRKLIQNLRRECIC